MGRKLPQTISPVKRKLPKVQIFYISRRIPAELKVPDAVLGRAWWDGRDWFSDASAKRR
jgi:hypothetical protein